MKHTVIATAAIVAALTTAPAFSDSIDDSIDYAYAIGYATGMCTSLSRQGEFGVKDRREWLQNYEKCFADAKKVGLEFARPNGQP